MGVVAEWIAVDWGTTHLRAYAMQGATRLAEAASDKGMNSLDRDGFEPALLALIAPWLAHTGTTPVLCCGMVGSRQGWAEAPYAAVPCAPVTDTPVPVRTHDRRLSVHILPGLSQASPADVMRGEECQIAGFLTLNDGWDGVICLPGTHSKWVHVSAGEVVSFQTFLTGEMFSLLAGQSVLRHSVGGDGWDDAAFDAAVSDTLARPESLGARLFRLRAEDLLQGTDSGTARATLSGLLIGAELAAAKPYWLGQQLAVIGADGPARVYTAALAAQGLPVTQARADAMTIAGLTAAWRQMKEHA